MDPRDKQDEADFEALEAMVDRHGLPSVLLQLAAICNEKSDHLASNWQDYGAASVWDKAGDILDTASARPNIQRTHVHLPKNDSCGRPIKGR